MQINLCQIDTKVGNFEGNVAKITNALQKKCALAEPAKTVSKQIFIFPELTICGYPLLDLANLSQFVDRQYSMLESLLEQTKDVDSLIIVGYVERNEGKGKSLFNSAAVCYKGEIIFNYRKRLLPTYDVFDEARYFEPGKEIGLFQFKGVRIGIVICEDLWWENDKSLYSVNPMQELFNANAEFVISINGSPSVVGRHEEKIEMVKKISRQYAMPIVYVNQVGGNDDIVFDGNSFVTNKRGVIVHAMPAFKEQIDTIDDSILPYHTQGIAPEGLLHKPWKSKFEFFTEQAIYGIKSYVEKCGFKGVCIGESGGIDSALVSALARDALGPDRVVGITMPSEWSSEGSWKDSETLCKNLGIEFHTVPIREYYESIVKGFNNEFGTPAKMGLMEENLQARIRGIVLMGYSNRFGYLVLSTGNKSELSVGYCTMYGDMCGGLSPISGMYKMEVFGASKYYNEKHGKEMIPQVIIDKEPSAELAPGQKDTDSLPPYPILDAILKYFIEGDLLNNAEKQECIDVIHANQTAAAKVCSLIKKAEFKRRQAPIGIKMHKKDFGFGRRIPIAQDWSFKL